MKKILIIAFIVVIFVGCSPNQVSIKDTSNPKLKVQNTFITVSPSKEKFFINSSEGWKATYEPLDAFTDEMILYKTKDGGKTWSEIANSKDTGSTLPGGDKIGMSFISSAKGWITAESPAEGKSDLYMTSDGGVTWSEQKIQIINEYKKSDIHTIPPLFFSSSNGILLAFASGDNNQIPLLYISGDGGDNWNLFANKESGVSNEIKWCFKGGNPGDYEVTYRNSTWILDGDTWAKKQNN